MLRDAGSETAKNLEEAQALLEAEGNNISKSAVENVLLSAVSMNKLLGNVKDLATSPGKSREDLVWDEKQAFIDEELLEKEVTRENFDETVELCWRVIERHELGLRPHQINKKLEVEEPEITPTEPEPGTPDFEEIPPSQPVPPESPQEVLVPPEDSKDDPPVPPAAVSPKDSKVLKPKPKTKVVEPKPKNSPKDSRAKPKVKVVKPKSKISPKNSRVKPKVKVVKPKAKGRAAPKSKGKRDRMQTKDSKKTAKGKDGDTEKDLKAKLHSVFCLQVVLRVIGHSAFNKLFFQQNFPFKN